MFITYAKALKGQPATAGPAPTAPGVRSASLCLPPAEYRASPEKIWETGLQSAYCGLRPGAQVLTQILRHGPTLPGSSLQGASSAHRYARRKRKALLRPIGAVGRGDGSAAIVGRLASQRRCGARCVDGGTFGYGTLDDSSGRDSLAIAAGCCRSRLSD